MSTAGRKESKKGRMWERKEVPNFIFPSPHPPGGRRKRGYGGHTSSRLLCSGVCVAASPVTCIEANLFPITKGRHGQWTGLCT